MKNALQFLLSAMLCLIFQQCSSAQDAFESSAATGFSTANFGGNYTGAQTQYVEDWFDPETYEGPVGSDATIIQGVNTSGPLLQGATNGTIGPGLQGVANGRIDTVFHSDQDGPMTAKDLEFRNLLIKVVSCDEPTPPGLFPPLPQFPALPQVDIGKDIAFTSAMQETHISRKCFENGVKLAQKEEFQEAGESFRLAAKFAADETKLRKSIKEELQNVWKKFQKKGNTDAQIACLRLSASFNYKDQSLQDFLDQTLKDNGKDPSDIAFRISAAEDLEESGDYQQASAEWRAVCNLTHSIENQLRLCSALSLAGGDQESLFILQRLLKGTWPDSNKLTQAKCHLALAKMFFKYFGVYSSKGANASAIAILENAVFESRITITLNPRDKEAQKLFITISKKITEIAPTEATNHFFLAASYVLAGDNAKANSEYDTCKRLEPNDDRLAQANLVMETLRADPKSIFNGRIGNSITKIQDLLDSDPHNVQLWRLLGRLYNQSADSEKAKACYVKANQVYFSEP